MAYISQFVWATLLWDLSNIKFGRQYYKIVQKTIKKIFKYKRFVQQEKK